MKIVFTANHRRTNIFAEAAKHLETIGHEVFWITTGSCEFSSVLAPFRNKIDISSSGTFQCPLDIFEQYSQISINGIIASDRMLSNISFEDAVNYISSVYVSVKGYLSSNGVELVFGEATWAHEMITAAVCRELGIDFLSPVNVRFPSSRFAFLKAFFRKRLFPPPVI